MPAKGAKKQPDGTWLVPDEADAEVLLQEGDTVKLEQVTELPCPECFPGGWPEGSYTVGCVHGTYSREVPGE